MNASKDTEKRTRKDTYDKQGVKEVKTWVERYDDGKERLDRMMNQDRETG